MSDLDRLAAARAGDYEIEREIGRGGMSTIYLARDLKHDRRVAIKVLHEELAASIGPERFLREIRIAARLTHPHILPLYDSGDAAGLLYYVMPFIEGETLRDRLKREPQASLEDTLVLGREVLDALAYAHGFGIVHRDIKPENILLSGGHAVVADFGVARAISDAAGGKLTQTGMALGTPAYMSPEQSAADPDLDGRADIYSTGCLLYEMLAGAQPFSGPTPHMIMARHSLDTAPPLRTVRPTVPHHVEQAITRAMAKHPSDRFADAREFADALVERAGVATPGIAGASRPARAKRLWLALAGAAGVLAMATAYLVSFPPGSAVAEAGDKVVVGLFANETGDPAYDDYAPMAADWITVELQRAGMIDVVPFDQARQASDFVWEELRRGQIADPLTAIAEEVDAAIVVSGRYRLRMDTLFLEAQVRRPREGTALGSLPPIAVPTHPDSVRDAIRRLGDRVTGFFAVALDDRVTATFAQPPTLDAYREFNQGMDAYVRQEWAEAAPYFERAFARDSTYPVPLLYATLAHLNANDTPTSDSLARELAAMRDLLTDYDRAWLDYLRAQLGGDRERARLHIRRAAELAPGSKAVYNAAYLALLTNRPREALRDLESLSPDRGPMRGWFPYWHQLVWALHELGEHERELEAAREARRRHPERITGLALEAEALAALGRTEEALALVDDMGHLSWDARNPGVVLLGLGQTFRRHGQPGAAREVLDRAVAWYEERPAVDHEREGTRRAFGTVLYYAERFERADSVFRELLEDHPDNVHYLGWRGAIAARRGDEVEAERYAQRLAAMTDPYMYGNHTMYRARIAVHLGRREEAVELLRQALQQGMLRFQLWLHRDFDVDPLRDYEPFIRLAAPKG